MTPTTPNYFDALQNVVFDSATTIFGYATTWQPLAGGSLVSGRMLFNKPTEKLKFSSNDYEYIEPKPTAEYKEGDFTGLYESVNAGTVETITINGVEYSCVQIEAKFDGKNYLITLQ